MGSFAMRAAERTGCRVTAVTVSRAPLELARAHVAAARLGDRVEVVSLDHRDVRDRASAPRSSCSEVDVATNAWRRRTRVEWAPGRTWRVQPGTRLAPCEVVAATGAGGMGQVCKARDTRLGRDVSHSMATIVDLCTSAILPEGGRLVAHGGAETVVARHTAMGRSQGGEVVRADPAAAPGTERLPSVRVLQDGCDGPTADVGASREVRVAISDRCCRAGAKLLAAIRLRDKVGTLVLSSSNHRAISPTDDSWSGRPRPTGRTVSTSRTPGNLLDDGLDTVSAIVGRGSYDPRILEDQVLAFSVHDSGETRTGYLGPWTGAVSPRLARATEAVARGASR